MKKLSVLVATVIVAMGASFTSCGDSHKSASLRLLSIAQATLLVSAQVPVIRKT